MKYVKWLIHNLAHGQCILSLDQHICTPGSFEWVEKCFVSKLLCLWPCGETRYYQSTLSMPFVIFFAISSPKSLTWGQGRLLTRPSAVLLPINICELCSRTLFYYRILSVQFSPSTVSMACCDVFFTIHNVYIFHNGSIQEFKEIPTGNNADTNRCKKSRSSANIWPTETQRLTCDAVDVDTVTVSIKRSFEGD